MSSRWDLVVMYACIPCAGRCHCRASTGSWVPVFSVRKLGQFLRALSGLLQCVAVIWLAVYWLWSSWLLATSCLQSSDSELALVDCEGSTSRPRDDRRTSRALVLESWAAWSSTIRASLGAEPRCAPSRWAHSHSFCALHAPLAMQTPVLRTVAPFAWWLSPISRRCSTVFTSCSPGSRTILGETYITHSERPIALMPNKMNN